MDERRSWEERRKFLAGKGSFFILKLLTIIKRYKLEHTAASKTDKCDCVICVEAEKLIVEAKNTMLKR